MTAIPSFRISVADRSTRDICSIYLVGGFDEEKNHYIGRPEFRGSKKQQYRDICCRAERGYIRLQQLVDGDVYETGDREAWVSLQLLVVNMLTHGFCEFRGLRYRFQVNSIDPETLDFLTLEVIAQVNEW
ncbi:hypothetical protein [Pseudomonas fortuita]|uniref:hypothetical protein n=1 Tax=Pseudomonas fortuita TaxID=3233375 RepID=UPI003C2F6FE3